MNMLRFLFSKRIQLAFIFVCLIFFILFSAQWFFLSNRLQTHAQAASTDVQLSQVKSGSTNHTVLVWHWPWGTPHDVSGDYCKENYGVSNCIIVDDHSRFSEADVVIFHNWEVTNEGKRLPVDLKRPEKQRWVWLTMETPMYNGNLKPFAGLFNWTMTYHRDADIYSPYGFMVPKETESNEPVENFIPKNKTHLACWVVGNLKPELERTILYQKLKEVMPIEVYGKKTRPLDGQALLPTISRCYFYLAFENSVFRDYITEKLWRNAYGSGAVPVVLGPSREDYEAVVAKDSFIHVNDFKSPEDLGEFLKKLAKDKERYASYFNWRRKYTVEVKDWEELFCRFCHKISSMPAHKVYQDLDAWQR